MKNLMKYTIVIPHKNSASLVKRCIDSVPERPDVEIIIVDDCSDTENIRKLYNIQHQNLQVIETHEGRGAGYARNVGIANARGTWLLFADADDYYVDGFLDIIDENINANLEVLYFNIYSDVAGKNNRAINCNRLYLDYNAGLATKDDVKYLVWGPWNKVVSREFIKKYNLHYEEIPSGNDAFFSFYVAQKAINSKIIQNQLYCLTNNPNSITYKKRTIEEEMRALALNIRIHQFIEKNTSCALYSPVCYSQNIKNVYMQGGGYALFRYVKYIHQEYSLRKTIWNIIQYKKA